MKIPAKWRFLPEDTALLIVDAQNDYLAPGGGLHELIKPQAERFNLIPNIKKLVQAARFAKIPVLYSRLAFTEGDYEIYGVQELSGLNRLFFDRDLFREETWGAEFFPELRPSLGDFTLRPHKGPDVFYSDLGHHLKTLGTDKLILAGLCANTAIEATANSARERGFDVTIARDSLGALTSDACAHALLWSLPFIANLSLDTAEVSRLMLAEEPPRDASLRGLQLYAGDQGWLGTISDVRADTMTESYLEAEHALPGREKLLIPANSICKVGGGKVFLNIPGQVVDLVIPGWAAEYKKAEAA